MANYNVQITNGSGSENMKSGNYTVTVSAAGYESTTLSPTSYTATASAGSGSFTLSANGVLTLVFNETGAAGGTPVTAGSVVMTDSTGNTEYGSPVTITAQGEAVFNNVPYSSASPYALYFKQTASDDTHNPIETVISVSMSEASETQYVLNSPIAVQTFSISDVNYSGLPIADATLTFTGE